MTFADDVAPSDYDTDDLEDEKTATVDYNEEDAQIRDALKRELLLLSSVTNRGDYANVDEQNILSKFGQVVWIACLLFTVFSPIERLSSSFLHLVCYIIILSIYHYLCFAYVQPTTTKNS